MNEVFVIIQWVLITFIASLCGSMMFVTNDNSRILRYSVGKSLGIISLAAISWVLSLTKILPFTAGNIWLILLLLVLLTLYFRHKIIAKFVKENYRQILVVESIVLGLFIIILITRTIIPKIDGVEKYMDMAILTGLMRHKVGAPVDTWFAPETINYYYFGHWIVAMLAKLSFTPANYAFNLGFASIISIAGGVVYAIVHKLTAKIWAGLLGIFLTFFASNMYIFISYLGFKSVFFFTSGRFTQTTINEYPFYSVILGDLHAHALGLILCVTLFGLIVIASDRRTTLQLHVKEYALIGCLLGLMAATNSFDIINSSVILGLYFCWEFIVRKLKIKQILKAITAIFIPFVGFLGLFMATFSAPVGGIAISFFKIPMIHIFWQFGLFSLLIVASCAAIGFHTNTREYLLKIIKSYKFLIVIFAVSACVLILFTEIAYLKDIMHYVNPAYAQANTQFKIWFAAWVMLSIAAAAAFAEALDYVNKNGLKLRKKILKILFVYFLIVSSVGTVSGYAYLLNANTGIFQTVDGTKQIKIYEPYKMALIKYVNENISGQPIILQYGGQSYSTNSWFSAYTGTASPLGWQSHEYTWRYGTSKYMLINTKYDAIRKAYEPTSLNDFKESLRNIKANYMLVGIDERNAYKVNDNIIRQYLGSPVFKTAGYELYKIPTAP